MKRTNQRMQAPDQLDHPEVPPAGIGGFADRHGFAAPERAPFPFALFAGPGFRPVEQVALDDIVGDAVIVEQRLRSGGGFGAAEGKRVKQQDGGGNADPHQLQQGGGPIGLDVGGDDDQAGAVPDGLVGVLPAKSASGRSPGLARARARSRLMHCPEECWGAIQVRSGLQVTRPTAWPSCWPRLASEAARMTPCSSVDLKPLPTWTRRSRSRKIHQSEEGMCSNWRTYSAIPPGGGGPVDGFERVAGDILPHRFHADGGFQGGAAWAAAFPGAPTSGDLDGRQRQHGRQHQQDGGVGPDQFHAAQPQRVAGTQGGRPKVEQATAGAGALGLPFHRLVPANRSDPPGGVARQVGMVFHLQPQGGQEAVIEDGKTLFQQVADLGPAIAHLAFHEQPAGQGERPEETQQPAPGQNDEQRAPGPVRPEQLQYQPAGWPEPATGGSDMRIFAKDELGFTMFDWRCRVRICMTIGQRLCLRNLT